MQPGVFDESHGHRPAEMFLDFDPVLPDWQPEPAAAPRAGSDGAGAGTTSTTVITFDDFRRIRTMLRDARARSRAGAYANALERKLRWARLVAPAHVAADVVTMNSTVRLFDTATGMHAPLTVVYPAMAGREAGAVSVLSSLGTAVLGQRAGERVGDRIDGESPRFVIEKVLYQPEAAGDLHL